MLLSSGHQFPVQHVGRAASNQSCQLVPPPSSACLPSSVALSRPSTSFTTSCLTPEEVISTWREARWFSWQTWQLCTMRAMSWSRPGHQTWDRATILVFFTPG
ncbi:uncharacterized protein LOC144168807 isoform X1 [Haemaphysalis longicornis]